MSYLLDGEKVTTMAGDYSIIWSVDEAPEAPYNDGFTLLTRGSRDQIDIQVGDTDSPVSQRVQRALYSGEISGAAIVRYLRLAGKKGVTAVRSDYSPAGVSAARSGFSPDVVYGVAWAPDDATDPDAYTEASLREWTAWQEGDVFGWVVESPDGDVIASCSGYFGYYTGFHEGVDSERDYTRQEALAAITADAEERLRRVNLAGAGFVGIV